MARFAVVALSLFTSEWRLSLWSRTSHSTILRNRFLQIFVLSGALILVALCTSAGAQIADPVLAAHVPVPGLGHDYIGMGSEMVNPADGSVTFDLPFQLPAGRGLSFPFRIRYSSSEPYQIVGSNGLVWSPYQSGSPIALGGWLYGLPAYSAEAFTVSSFPDPSGQGTDYCGGSGNYVFWGLDGIERGMSVSNQWRDPNNRFLSGCSPFASGGAGYGVSAGVPSLVGSAAQPPLTVSDRSGTVYQFPGGPVTDGDSTVTWGMLAQTITDRNGNQIVLNCPNACQELATGNLSPTFLAPGSYTDTLGRRIISWTGIGSSGDQFTISGLGGNIVVRWTNVTVTFPARSYPVINPVVGGTCSFSGTPSFSVKKVSEIDLPNGQHYSFTYGGPWGRLLRIAFPDGGYVRYAWNVYPNSAAVFASWVVSAGAEVSCWATFDNVGISDRYVSYDGTTEVLHQQFLNPVTNWVPENPNAPVAPLWTTKTATVRSTDLLSGRTTLTQYTYSPVNSFGGLIPVEQQIVYQDGTTGATLKTVNKTWFNQYDMIGEQTILDNGQGATTLRCYGGSDLVLDTYEYGFQSEGAKPADPPCALVFPGTTLSSGLNVSAIGPLKRHTATVYHNFPTTNIFDEPDSVTVYDGSGSKFSQTTYAYDRASVLSSGAGTGLVSPPGLRGNPTSVSRWLNTTNSYLTNSYTYFDTGQLASSTDPCGTTACSDMAGTNHTTTYSYTDSYSSGTPPGNTNAYLTTVTHPTANGVTAHEYYQYDYPSGQLTVAKDDNSNLDGLFTSYSYSDPLARLTSASYPNGEQISYVYNDSSYNPSTPSPSVTTTTAILANLNKVTTTAFDGLGHTVETILNSDPDGVTYTNTVYDGSGRPYKVYNPYRSTSDPTYGVTTYIYDALGRNCLLAPPDAAAPGATCPTSAPANNVFTSYSGNCITVTDQAGKSRKSCSDGLGRL